MRPTCKSDKDRPKAPASASWWFWALMHSRTCGLRWRTLSQLSIAWTDQHFSVAQSKMWWTSWDGLKGVTISDRDRDIQDTNNRNNQRSKSGCLVTTFQAVYALRKIKLQTRQAHQSKACNHVCVMDCTWRHLNIRNKSWRRPNVEKTLRLWTHIILTGISLRQYSTCSTRHWSHHNRLRTTQVMSRSH